MLVKMGSSSPNRDEDKIYFKPPPRFTLTGNSAGELCVENGMVKLSDSKVK